MKVAIVKYNAGNIHSVYCALTRLGAEVVITDDPAELRAADKVVFPGVGQAASSMAYLKEHGLDEVIRSLTQPVLGICIGMQLLCRHSAEGDVDCLGVFDQTVLRFDATAAPDCKVPQMGWNQITDLRTPLFDGVEADSHVYYVHSYYVPQCAETIATTDYIHPYSAALHRGNFYATQFHPEKSGSIGERILRNFLEKC
jgi:glutamine amidotransferase